MKSVIGFGMVAITCLVAACSDGTTLGPTKEAARTGNTQQALYNYSDSGTTFDCTTITGNSWGTNMDVYDETAGSPTTTLYAFLNAAKNAADADVVLHNGSGDYGNSAEEMQADLASAISTLSSLKSWLLSGPLNATNASAAYSTTGDLNEIARGTIASITSGIVSSVYNYGSSGPNNASKATLYARKAAELANQAAADATYCYLNAYSREVPNGASWPNMACVP